MSTDKFKERAKWGVIGCGVIILIAIIIWASLPSTPTVTTAATTTAAATTPVTTTTRPATTTTAATTPVTTTTGSATTPVVTTPVVTTAAVTTPVVTTPVVTTPVVTTPVVTTATVTTAAVTTPVVTTAAVTTPVVTTAVPMSSYISNNVSNFGKLVSGLTFVLPLEVRFNIGSVAVVGEDIIITTSSTGNSMYNSITQFSTESESFFQLYKPQYSAIQNITSTMPLKNVKIDNIPFPIISISGGSWMGMYIQLVATDLAKLKSSFYNLNADFLIDPKLSKSNSDSTIYNLYTSKDGKSRTCYSDNDSRLLIALSIPITNSSSIKKIIVNDKVSLDITSVGTIGGWLEFKFTNFAVLQ